MDLCLHPTLICFIEEPIESILISNELILISHELHRRFVHAQLVHISSYKC